MFEFLRQNNDNHKAQLCSIEKSFDMIKTLLTQLRVKIQSDHVFDKACVVEFTNDT